MKRDSDPLEDGGVRFRTPCRADGQALHALVSECPPLDLNSVYLYLLLTEHFSRTCIVAEDARGLAGMVTAYRPPGRDGVLFVWQVAVHPRVRGQGIGRRMLHLLLARQELSGVRWVETTVDPQNHASRGLFRRLADDLRAPLKESVLFEPALFGAQAHEAEPLLRIGPFSLSAVSQVAVVHSNVNKEETMDLKIFERMESEVRGYVRSFPVIFAKARGSELFDEAGRSYIDFFSGAGTLNYGHNNPILQERMVEYLSSDGVVHGLDMATSAKKHFLQTLDRLVLKPRGLDYKVQFTGPTGTNAVEAALKLARQVKGRQNIISFTHGFHGVSGGSLAVTANQKFRKAAGVALGNTSFMPFDGYFGPDVDTMAWLERMLDDPSSGLDHPAAVIVETVQGEGGVNVASQRWLRELERLCRRHDMLLIVDDIQVGCGRTRDFFSFEAAGISPDIVTLSKSLSGAGLPMSLVLFRRELDVWEPGAHSGTFRGNNLAFVTAAQALESYWADDALSKEVESKEALVRDWLENLAHSCRHAGLTVRGRGLIQGLATPVGDDLANQIARRAFQEGLVVETSGARDEVLKILPALTIPREQLTRGLEIIERCTNEVLASLGRRPQVLKVAGSN